jgi:hypothetical protein
VCAEITIPARTCPDEQFTPSEHQNELCDTIPPTVGNRSYRKLFSSALWKVCWFAAHVVADALIGAMIFATLVLYARLFAWGRVAQVPQEHNEILERIHFWLNAGLFVAIGSAMILHVLTELFRTEEQ